MRKEKDYTNELTCTLDEIEEKERLEEDCKKTEKVNKHMQYIKEQFIVRLEELRKEFILTKHISRENQGIVNQVFGFLKEKS